MGSFLQIHQLVFSHETRLSIEEDDYDDEEEQAQSFDFRAYLLSTLRIDDEVSEQQSGPYTPNFQLASEEIFDEETDEEEAMIVDPQSNQLEPKQEEIVEQPQPPQEP